MSTDLKSITVPVYLNFIDNTWTSSSNISIPFGVKEIIVKQVLYQDSLGTGFSQLNSNALLVSDLVEYQVLSLVTTAVYSSTAHFVTIIDNIRFIYNTPKRVDGSYTFSLKNLANTLPFQGNNNYPTTNYNMVVLLEFINQKNE